VVNYLSHAQDPALSTHALRTPGDPMMSLIRYVDVVLILMIAPIALLIGAPVLGYAVGTVAWTAQRFAGAAIERRALASPDPKRAIGVTLFSSLGRVWLLALTILAVGLLGEKKDGLTAALVVFFAFTVYFGMSLVTRPAQARKGRQP
jgi:hypothetical protein